MPKSNPIAVFATACVVGVASGLFGVGGGVLLVPLLVLLHHYGQHRAQGTSLIALVPPTGLLAFITYYRAHQVDVRTGLLIIPVFACILFVLGAWEFLGPFVRSAAHAAR